MKKLLEFENEITSDDYKDFIIAAKVHFKILFMKQLKIKNNKPKWFCEKTYHRINYLESKMRKLVEFQTRLNMKFEFKY